MHFTFTKENDAFQNYLAYSQVPHAELRRNCHLHFGYTYGARRMIPDIIHFTAASWETLPLHYKYSIATHKRKWPESTVYFWSDAACEALMSGEPGYVRDMYYHVNGEYGPAKADIIRYCLLKNYGGLYLDVKSSVTEWSKFMLSTYDTRPLALWNWDWPNRAAELPESRGKGEICNWVMASAPNHPIWTCLLSAIAREIKQELASQSRGNPAKHGKEAVLNLTGPLIMSRTFYPILNCFDYTLTEAGKTGFTFDPSGNHQKHSKKVGKTVHYSKLKTPIVLQQPVAAPTAPMNKMQYVQEITGSEAPTPDPSGNPQLETTNATTAIDRSIELVRDLMQIALVMGSKDPGAKAITMSHPTVLLKLSMLAKSLRKLGVAPWDFSLDALSNPKTWDSLSTKAWMIISTINMDPGDNDFTEKFSSFFRQVVAESDLLTTLENLSDDIKRGNPIPFDASMSDEQISAKVRDLALLRGLDQKSLKEYMLIVSGERGRMCPVCGQTKKSWEGMICHAWNGDCYAKLPQYEKDRWYFQTKEFDLRKWVTERQNTGFKYDMAKDFPALTETAKLTFAKRPRKPRSVSECTGTTKGAKPVPEGLDEPGSDSDEVLSDVHDGIVGSPVDLDAIEERMTAVNVTGSPWASVPASSSSSSSLAVPPPPKCPTRL